MRTWTASSPRSRALWTSSAASQGLQAPEYRLPQVPSDSPAAGSRSPLTGQLTPVSRIVVAMSGGVDSSVAAALLSEQGHEVIGLSMQLYDQRGPEAFGSCCSLDDLHD